MRRIKISDEVWDAIAAKGKFGETEDDVLRRVLDLQPFSGPARLSGSGRVGRGNRRFANKSMSARVEGGHLVVHFEDGARKQWKLPERSDKAGMRDIRQAAIAFALENGATDPGQTNAVRKALTDAGYHLTKR